MTPPQRSAAPVKSGVFLVAQKRTEGQLRGLLVCTAAPRRNILCRRSAASLGVTKAITTAVPDRCCGSIFQMAVCLYSDSVPRCQMRALWSCFCVLFTSVLTQLNERQAEVQEKLAKNSSAVSKRKEKSLCDGDCARPLKHKKKNIRGISFICSSYEIPSCSDNYKDTRPSKDVKKNKKNPNPEDLVTLHFSGFRQKPIFCLHL